MSRLELRGLAKAYGHVAALDGLDLDVPAGSRTAIVGPSGCGKTTLLRLVAGFEAPDAGRVTLGGERLAEGQAAVPAHRRGIGLVAQDGALFPHLDVADNIGFGLPRRLPDRTARIAALLDTVGLPRAVLARKPDELSGGQQQRVALARALARAPRLMLLDEPFSALDTGLRAATREAVAALLGARSITTVLVTHDQAEALSFADQVAVMRAGRLSAVGPPRELYLRPGDALVAEFLGEALILPADLEGGWATCPLGRLPTDAPVDRQGPARLMLRPEQVGIGPQAHDGVPATVLGFAFAGAQCIVTVQVPGASPLALRGTSFAPLAPGAGVRLTVTGPAHVLRA